MIESSSNIYYVLALRFYVSSFWIRHRLAFLVICFPCCVLGLIFILVGFHAPDNASPIVQRCEPWDFNNNTNRSKGNYNVMNESKGACRSKIVTIRLKVTNFERREGGGV